MYVCACVLGWGLNPNPQGLNPNPRGGGPNPQNSHTNIYSASSCAAVHTAHTHTHLVRAVGHTSTSSLHVVTLPHPHTHPQTHTHTHTTTHMCTHLLCICAVPYNLVHTQVAAARRSEGGAIRWSSMVNKVVSHDTQAMHSYLQGHTIPCAMCVQVSG